MVLVLSAFALCVLFVLCVLFDCFRMSRETRQAFTQIKQNNEEMIKIMERNIDNLRETREIAQEIIELNKKHIARKKKRNEEIGE
jgi:ABC-type multidrug transport system fused ATPase/permease subunit